MRIWMNQSGDMLTDEQLLRYIATFGSLSAAGAHDDIQLLPTKDEPLLRDDKPVEASVHTSVRNKQKYRLIDYLEADRS